jgi:hypothetical protein
VNGLLEWQSGAAKDASDVRISGDVGCPGACFVDSMELDATPVQPYLDRFTT